jgi:hypothetical protein
MTDCKQPSLSPINLLLWTCLQFCCLALGMARTTLKTSHVIGISPVHWGADCCLATSCKHSSCCCLRLSRGVYLAVDWQCVKMSQYFNLKMEAICFSETSDFFQITSLYNSEDHILHNHGYGNLIYTVYFKYFCFLMNLVKRFTGFLIQTGYNILVDPYVIFTPIFP